MDDQDGYYDEYGRFWPYPDDTSNNNPHPYVNSPSVGYGASVSGQGYAQRASRADSRRHRSSRQLPVDASSVEAYNGSWNGAQGYRDEPSSGRTTDQRQDQAHPVPWAINAFQQHDPPRPYPVQDAIGTVDQRIPDAHPPNQRQYYPAFLEMSSDEDQANEKTSSNNRRRKMRSNRPGHTPKSSKGSRDDRSSPNSRHSGSGQSGSGTTRS